MSEINNVESHESHENQTEESGGFLSNIPWKYIIMGIIIVLIIMASVQAINAIGKIGQPLIDALGDIAKSGASILNNCLPQSDCVKIGNCDQCKNTYGCSCTADEKNCQNISGRDVGTGGFFTPSCGLGIGFILAGLGALVITVLSFIQGWKASPAVEKISKAENKPVDTVVKELVNETKAEVNRTEEQHKAENNGEELSPEAKPIIEKAIVESKLADRQYESAQNLPSTEEKATMQNEAKTRYDESIRDINQKIEESKIPENEQKTIENTIEENKPKFEE